METGPFFPQPSVTRTLPKHSRSRSESKGGSASHKAPAGVFPQRLEYRRLTVSSDRTISKPRRLAKASKEVVLRHHRDPQSTRFLSFQTPLDASPAALKLRRQNNKERYARQHGAPPTDDAPAHSITSDQCAVGQCWCRCRGKNAVQPKLWGTDDGASGVGLR